MATHNTSRLQRESLEVSSVERPGWTATSDVPSPGSRVFCLEGEAEVVRVLGKVSDGSRLLELSLPDRPKSYFASSANILVPVSDA